MHAQTNAQISVSNRWNRHVSVYEPQRPADLNDATEFVDALFATGETIKQSKRSTLIRAQSGAARFVAKCYKTRKMRYLTYSFIHGRGSLPAWNNIFLLRSLGIPTLEPVLLLEQRFLRFPGESFLVTREITGDNLSVYLEKNNGEIAEFQLEALRQMFATFYAQRLIHGDLNEDNIMITADGPIILDLDKLSKPTTAEQFHASFAHERDRFLRKLLPWPAGRERIAGTFPALD